MVHISSSHGYPCSTALPAPASFRRLGATGGQPRCSRTFLHPSINRRPVPACKSAAEAAAAVAAAEQCEQQQQQGEQPDSLETLLRWLLANGAEGVGEAGSKAGLYEGVGGERGLVALVDIGEGEAVLRIPLRLAITDYEEDALAGQGGGGAGQDLQREEQRAWSARLAARLLALWAQGPASPWAPYLACLPPRVPSPLTSFSWEDVRAVEYQVRRGLQLLV